jgi:16S rRNA (guanine527-N7)-methyltransferase
VTGPSRPRIQAAGADLGAVAHRYGLPAAAATQLLSLLELVATDPLAPTSVRDPQAIVADHLADSLVALELPVVRDAGSIADIGSGAGFPGLPLAIALPESSVELADGSSRKCTFITRAIDRCAVSNARAVHTRAEEWAEGLGAFDLVTTRAMAPLPVVAEYAAPLLRVGGSLVAWTGRHNPGDEVAARRAATELGLEAGEPVPVRPYPSASHRHLQLMLKVRETPSRFPRRPGVARRRPLGIG